MNIRVALYSLLLVLGPALSGCTSAPARAAPEVRQALAPTGSLRVALYTGTPTSQLSETDLRGVGYDLGKELAHRLGVPFQPLVFTKNADVLDAVSGGRADVAFTNASPERAQQMDFTQPYLVIELGYLAREKAPVATLTDVDKPGVRVGVTAKSSSDAVLSRDLKNAAVVRAETVGAGVQMLAAGTLDLYATNKATLFEMADKLPGARMLDGSWGEERHAIAIPRGRERGLPYARAFVADAISSGLVRTAVARAGLRGATVASRSVPAEDIRVVISGGFAAAFKELSAKFEQRTHNHLIAEWGASMGTTPTAIPMRLDRGEAVDVVILAREGLDPLVKKGQVVAGSEVDLVRSKIAMAVRQGAPAPDISTVAAFKHTLLSAKSVAYSDSASGVYLSGELFKHLGIEKEMAGKSRMIPGTPVGETVARGEAEIGFQQYSELLPVAGIRIVGPIPEEVQKVTVFAAGITTTARAPQAARALVHFLASPEAVAAIKASGLVPVNDVTAR